MELAKRQAAEGKALADAAAAKSRSRALLDEALVKTIQLSNAANLLAAEFRTEVRFKPTLAGPYTPLMPL